MQDQNPYSTPNSNLSGRDSFSTGGAVTQGVVHQILKTKGWTRFIGVLAIIGAVFIFGVTVAGAQMLDTVLAKFEIPFAAKGAKAIVIGIGLLVGGIALAYGLLLNGFSSAATRLIASGKESDLEDTLDRQRQFWVFWGIISTIQILFAIIGLFASIG